MKRFWFLLCLLCFTLGLENSGWTQPPFVVILLPGTSLSNWQAADAPHLHQLMETGALAVMNTRTARLPNDHARETPQSAALTLGAGARAAGVYGTEAFLPPSATVPGLGISAGELWVRRTGAALPRGRYVNVRWPAVLSANKRLGYRLRLGALADVLALSAVPALAGGGSYAYCVASAGDGSVRPAPALRAAPGQCLIWDAGSNVPAADDLIGSAAAQVSRLHGRLLIVSPFADNHDFASGRRLTPILEWGEGVPRGLLRSPSTRRAGLVTDTDFAPTVAAFFGIRREDFPFRPFGELWAAVPAPENERLVGALAEQAVKQADAMRVLPYLAILLAAWMLVGTALNWRGQMPRFWPVAPPILVTALLVSTGSVSLVLWLVLFLALGGLLAARAGPRHAVLLLLATFAAGLLWDLLTGSRLMQHGLLGYSAIEGARYYGIGNEAMGALIGVLLVLTARLWPHLGRARWTLILLLGMVALLMGSANAGAKAGGLLVSLAAFGTLGFTLLGGRWSTRAVLGLGGTALGAMALAAAGDAVWGQGAHSHIGEAVRRIQSGGWSEAGDIVTRKLTVEGHLALHSAWACPLWGGLLCLALTGRAWKVLSPEERGLRLAGLVGIAACVALNDAGVVAGALCLVPLWCDSAVDVIKRKPLEQHLLSQGRPSEEADY